MEETHASFGKLIARAKLGDKDAFAVIYESHLTPVFRYLYARLGNREESEDLAQETFLKAYQALERFESTHDSFLPYLFTVARNLLINRVKKKTPQTMPAEDLDREQGNDSTSSLSEKREQSESIQKALEVLTESEREVIELRFFAERTYTEIAVILEKREDAVRQQVARAIKKMRLNMATFE